MTIEDPLIEVKYPGPTLKLIWLTLLGSILAYVYISNSMMEQTTPLNPQFLFILLGTSIFALVVSQFFRIRAYQFTEDMTRQQKASHLFTNPIISWVANESVAIYGLVIRIKSADPIGLAFVAAAFIFLAANYPRVRRLHTAW